MSLIKDFLDKLEWYHDIIMRDGNLFTGNRERHIFADGGGCGARKSAGTGAESPLGMRCGDRQDHAFAVQGTPSEYLSLDNWGGGLILT